VEEIGFKWLKISANPDKYSPTFELVAGTTDKYHINATGQLNLPLKATIQEVKLAVWDVGPAGGIVPGSDKYYSGEATVNPLITTFASFNLYSIGRDANGVRVQFVKGKKIKVAFQVKWTPNGGTAGTELFGEKVVTVE
jgi:hypothetical protein